MSYTIIFWNIIALWLAGAVTLLAGTTLLLKRAQISRGSKSGRRGTSRKRNGRETEREKVIPLMSSPPKTEANDK